MPSVECGFADIPGGAQGAQLLTDHGPTLLVDIGFDPAWNAAAIPPRSPTPGIQGIQALVDTGATECCIDSLLAASLNLPIIDRRVVSGVHGPAEVSIHLAQVHVPSLGFTMHGVFAGVHLVAGGQVHQALIGRTFLRYFNMAYDGRVGRVTIAT